ncbi:MAG: FAD-binding protein [Desulfotomaculaceae bacterium]
MAEKLALITQQLISLLGEPNVTTGKESIVARPSSSEEIAGIFALAAQAELIAKAVGYTVGPTTEAVGQTDILISLERMNQIKFDRESGTITAQPAAGMDQIINATQETGCRFPGVNCRHKNATVGENVAACFNEGEPDFKCPTACLYGLELVLADGRIITVGERSAKDLDNYQLTYILGGYKEEKAVLGGIHLRLLPAEQDQYWLITTFNDLDMFPGIWPSLMQKYRRELGAVVVIKLANYPELAGIMSQWIPDLNEVDHPSAACMLVSINCHPGELEQFLELLTGDLYESSPTNTSIAGGTYQKLVISTFYSNLLRDLKANPRFSTVSIDEQDYNQQINVGRINAVYWLKEESKVHLFYED